jgi:hypothetical protein
VRNSEPAFLDLIYYRSPVTSLIRNKYCWPNDADSLRHHTVAKHQSTEAKFNGVYAELERVSSFVKSSVT